MTVYTLHCTSVLHTALPQIKTRDLTHKSKGSKGSKGRHLVGRLEAGVGDLSDGELLVVGLLRGDDGRVGGEREVDARVRHQVGLELRQVHVQSAVEAQGRRDRRDDLLTQETR